MRADCIKTDKFTTKVKVFVKSNEDWSGQPVDEWVAVECAQHKLKQAKEEDIARLQKELEQAKNLYAKSKKN